MEVKEAPEESTEEPIKEAKEAPEKSGEEPIKEAKEVPEESTKEPVKETKEVAGDASEEPIEEAKEAPEESTEVPVREAEGAPEESTDEPIKEARESPKEDSTEELIDEAKVEEAPREETPQETRSDAVEIHTGRADDEKKEKMNPGEDAEGAQDKDNAAFGKDGARCCCEGAKGQTINCRWYAKQHLYKSWTPSFKGLWKPIWKKTCPMLIKEADTTTECVAAPGNVKGGVALTHEEDGCTDTTAFFSGNWCDKLV